MKRYVYLLAILLAIFITGCTTTTDKVSSVTIEPTYTPAPELASSYILNTTYDNLQDYIADVIAFRQERTDPSFDTVKSSNPLKICPENAIDIWLPVDVPYTDGINQVYVTQFTTAFLSYRTSGPEHPESWYVPIAITIHHPINNEVANNINIFEYWPINGSINSWKFERDDIVFGVMEFYVDVNKTITTYLVRWAYEGVWFSAGNLPSWFTEDEIARLANFKRFASYEEYVAYTGAE